MVYGEGVRRVLNQLTRRGQTVQKSEGSFLFHLFVITYHLLLLFPCEQMNRNAGTGSGFFIFHPKKNWRYDDNPNSLSLFLACMTQPDWTRMPTRSFLAHVNRETSPSMRWIYWQNCKGMPWRWSVGNEKALAARLGCTGSIRKDLGLGRSGLKMIRSILRCIAM